jgi:hypothetical protein
MNRATPKYPHTLNAALAWEQMRSFALKWRRNRSEAYLFWAEEYRDQALMMERCEPRRAA